MFSTRLRLGLPSSNISNVVSFVVSVVTLCRTYCVWKEKKQLTKTKKGRKNIKIIKYKKIPTHSMSLSLCMNGVDHSELRNSLLIPRQSPRSHQDEDC